ncbi:MAG: GTP-binding protein [Kiritimatiellia bacterium]
MSSIPIYLVVGFIGSGKTSLLRRLVHATEDRNFIFVINEVSAVDIDSAQIEKEGGAAVAFVGGSVFSRRQMPGFVSFMEKISGGVLFGGEHLRPDAVIIETSAMTDPCAADRALKESGLDHNYHIAGITAVVDPGVLMLLLLLLLPDIKRQIQCADLILFNKTDLRSTELINRVTERVRSLNCKAPVLHCTYCDVDAGFVLEFLPFSMK